MLAAPSRKPSFKLIFYLLFPDGTGLTYINGSIGGPIDPRGLCRGWFEKLRLWVDLQMLPRSCPNKTESNRCRYVRHP